VTTPGIERSSAPDAVPLLLGAHWYRDDPGGLHRYLADLFGALRQAGVRPIAVVSGPAADAPVGIVGAGRFDRPFPVRLWGYCRGVNRAVAAGGVDVVDAHFAFYALWPVVVGRLRHLPLVVHFQGPWAEESRVAGQESDWRLAAKRKVETSVYRRASGVVVLSAAFKALLVERYGVAPWLVEVIPPGIDLATFSVGSREGARVALGLPAGARVVVSVRRLVPRMGIDVLIEAWAEVAGDVPDGVLLIVGDGPERDRLRHLADRAGVESSVRFLGIIDEETLVRCYQAADVSVVPTLALEGFGLVVLESLACGTPAIVSNSGGLPEAVADLDRSLIVPAADAGALARRLRSALDGSAPAPARLECRAHAEAFAWPAIAERHRALYNRAVHPGRRRLRVVFLDHCARLSGGELALLRLLPELDVDAHVILAETGPLVEKLRDAGISVEVLPIAGSTGSLGREQVSPGGVPVSAVVDTGTYVARLAARLRRLRPDLVHTNSLKSALYGGVAGRLASVPVVWHVRDRITPDYMPPPACRLVRAAARLLPTAVIANSRTTLSTLGRAGEGGVAVASPLGFAPFPDGPAQRPGALRIGIVGRLDPWKGQHVFLDAFAAAFPDGGAEAVIVGGKLFGDQGYVEDLERQVKTLGLEGRVEFRGFRDDIEEELAGLDVLVHASTIPEPFGQVVVEGMAAGLAVVAADAGGPAEVVTHGVDGLLYPPGDAHALAGALRDLAADPARRRRLGDAARRRAHDFTPARIAPQVMAVYETRRRP
jgi:glycosyltransferase involved in cell wall biosynthesis